MSKTDLGNGLEMMNFGFQMIKAINRVLYSHSAPLDQDSDSGLGHSSRVNRPSKTPNNKESDFALEEGFSPLLVMLDRLQCNRSAPITKQFKSHYEL